MRRGDATFTVAAEKAKYVWPPAERFGGTRLELAKQFSRTMPALGVVTLAGGAVHGPDGWVHDRAGVFLPELSWYGDNLKQIEASETVPPKSEWAHVLEGRCLTLGTNWGSHFGHFVPDAIGRIGVFLGAGFSLDDVDHVLLPVPPESAAATALLERTGIPESKIRYLTWESTYVAETLYAPTFPGLRRQYSSLATDYLRSLYPPERPPARRLMVTREGFARNPRQAAQLEAAAVAAGFELYDPMTSPDQAADFRDAQIVIGVSGSALTNIVYCQPGATVLEIFSDSHPYGYYYSLSGAARLRYGYLFGSSGDAVRSIGASEADFDVDVATFERALQWAVGSRS